MILTLQRDKLNDYRTFGRLIAQDDHRLCYTLEDAVREVRGQPVSAWKVKGATAIPVGEYRVTMEFSPRFGPETLTVNNVPGFTGVRMHAGNTELDTEGCPLLGMAIDPHGIVGGTSRQAVALIKGIVRQAIDDGEMITLRVLNPLER